MSMYCFQCQESAGNKGCTTIGVCGKDQDVAGLQDLLIFLLKGISVYSVKARELGVTLKKADTFVMEQLFTTITNVNFNPDQLTATIKEGFLIRDEIRQAFMDAYRNTNGAEFRGELPEAATWYSGGDKAEFLIKAQDVGILAQENEDVRSLRELLIIGVKGIAAYAHHAHTLGYDDPAVHQFMQEALASTTDDSLAVNDMIGLVLKAGEVAVTVMALLDKANTDNYGLPEPTDVNIGVGDRPGILISGHDLRDLEELLEQTQDSGVDVYTHGEMLPAHAYPNFKGYKNFIGNYGNSWWLQDKEFESFNGPVLMTTNCLVPPKSSYIDRVYTTGVVSYPGVKHIVGPGFEGKKDFTEIIEHAKTCKAPQELETGNICVGFAHDTIMSVAPKIIEAVKSGAIKRFFVMAGCDGRFNDRSYYTELAQQLPEDTIILTAGCAKYRYNKLGLGDIGGIPRVIDAGQCNDSYSLAVVAMKLVEAFGAGSINDLPISFDIAWYEQKAVTVLLALLHLGVKNIRLGPTLPAFLSPGVAKVLVETFDIKPISTVEDDIAAMMQGN